MSRGSERRHFWEKEVFGRRAKAVWDVYLRTRTHDLRDQLVEMYMPLTGIAARKLCNTLPAVVEMEDLRADAALGVLGAVERWRPEEGVFVMYIFQRMRHAMYDGLRERDPVSRWGRMLLTRLMEAKKMFMKERGGEPSVGELARLARLPYKICARHVGLAVKTPFVSIEAMSDAEEPEAREEMMADRLEWMGEADPDKYFREVVVRDFIEWLLAQIEDPRSRRICHAYLVEGVGQRDIGRAEGLHESRIFQLLEECRAVWLERSAWLRKEKEARDG